MLTINFKHIFTNKEFLENIFISTNNNWQSTEEKDFTVIESGPKKILFHKIIKQIQEAKKMICLQSFLIQDTRIIDELIKASQRNVKVYVLDAAETRLKTQAYSEDDSFISDEYKEMINKKFRGNIVHRQAENLHAKFILIDPKTENAQGFLCTGNFNLKPFIENPELGVPLSETQVNEFFQLFVYHFWEHTTHEQNTTETFDAVKPVRMFEAPKINNVLCTSPNSELSNLKSTLFESIKNAKESISFSTFGLDINHELAQEILLKIKEGISVTIFCRLREKTITNHISELQKAGAIVYCHPLIHAKSIVIDQKEAYVFTANFEKHGMDSGFEVGVLLDKIQTKDLIHIHTKWIQHYPYIFYAQKSIQEVTAYETFKNNDLKSCMVAETNKIEQTKDISKLVDLAIFFENVTEKDTFKNHKKIELNKVAKIKPFNENEATKLEAIDEIVARVFVKETIIAKNKKDSKASAQPEIKWKPTNKIVMNTKWANDNPESLIHSIHTKWSNYKNWELYGK